MKKTELDIKYNDRNYYTKKLFGILYAYMVKIISKL